MTNNLFTTPKKASVATLRRQFKTANKRVDKAFARYKKALFPLYAPFDGKHGVCTKLGLVDVYLTCLDSNGNVREFATDIFDEVYRLRGKKLYKKSQPKTYCQSACGNCTFCDDRISQDYLDLRKLECAIDDAVDLREKLLSELEDLGVDVYKDDSLW